MQRSLATPEEIAAYFQVEPSTVRRWHRKGILPGIKLANGMIRWNWDDVARAIETGKVEKEETMK